MIRSSYYYFCAICHVWWTLE